MKGNTARRQHGLQGFHIREITVGKDKLIRWEASGCNASGKQIRKRFPSRDEAQGFVDRQSAKDEREAALMLPRRTRLSGEQLEDAEAAFALLNGTGSLMDAVSFFREHYHKVEREILLLDAIPLYEAYKEKRNIRARSLAENLFIIKAFAALHPISKVNEITPADLEAFLAGSNPRTYNTKRGRLASFFTWAAKENYCSASPVAKTEATETDQHDPQVFDLDQVKRIIKAARETDNGAMLPFVAAGLFCGLRPDEICRLQWASVDLEEKQITISGKDAKTRRRRIVEIPDNAVAWLKLGRGKAFAPKPFKGYFNRFKRAAGFMPDKFRLSKDERTGKKRLPDLEKWIRDGLRHTALSQHLAMHGNENKTALWAGNSPRVLHANYKGLVRKSEAAAFWSITPDNIDDKGKVAKMPAKSKSA